MSERRLLVLGVGSELGSLATAFMEHHQEFTDIVGIDVHPPRRRLRRTEFVRVEHANRSELVRRIVAHRPDVLVHMGVWEPHARVGTAEARIATQNYASALCEALEHLNDLSRLVIRSGVEVYGARPTVSPDEHSPVAPSSTYGQMLSELETMLHESAPATATVTTLRLAPVIGAHVPSPLGRLLRLPVVPIDPFSRAMFQVVADDDAARAFAHAALHGHHSWSTRDGSGIASYLAHRHDPHDVGGCSSARPCRGTVATWSTRIHCRARCELSPDTLDTRCVGATVFVAFSGANWSTSAARESGVVPYINRPGGVRLHAEVTGRSDAPVVLLIQGLGTDKNGWILQRFGMATRYRTIAFDNRGSGRSTTPDEPFTL
ncbi:MAG: NAD-dependent epimerase/dehydratase family protein, partial [Actinobacteria bacterium]|nr:NAD-dependent epimerase/dehydratase family protein [Actinomycetota bacterium]